mmetsp:Transcript_7665/g.20317  ORF Transcript_7665/g.20317 Transcript_7665/m.20317 type:complete len:230 (-) Transcript_7665:613-1302(-)
MSGEKFDRKSPKIVSKMPAFDASDISAKPTTLNGLTNRAVMSCRPPPGGPSEAMKTMSMIFLNARSFDRSNQPPCENHCRKISMGGWAPYVSRFGMFKSSTWMAWNLPAGGPKIPRLRFSNLPSKVSCVIFADVCALNVIVRGMSSEGADLPSHFDTPWRYCEIFTVLPVPVSPTIMQWYLFASNLAKIKVLRTESGVGTMSSAKDSFESTLYSSIVDIHPTHFDSSES